MTGTGPMKSTNGVGTISPALMRAIARVLRPLVRLLLDHGITFPTLEEMVKSTYVRVAVEEFARDSREPNDSRVSTLTGIHRKDVKRLRGAPLSANLSPLSITVGGQIIAQWIARPEFLDSRNRPRQLPRLRSNGGSCSFEALAESISKDVGSRAILDELVRLGIARVNNRDRVCLETAALVPRKGTEEKAYSFGLNIHDHLAVVAHNLRGDLPPQLESSIHCTNLSQESIEQLAAAAERAGIAALTKINRRADELRQRSRGGTKDGRNITFGVYFHRSPAGSVETGGANGERNVDGKIAP